MSSQAQAKYIIPKKSALDKREYRVITLQNDLQVLLVHDPETEKAAAAMDVHVGHFSDPDQIPGLAHFLEHMLFLGTKKYPDENSYSTYLSQHGGSSNAYTSTENTNYHFDVLAPHLEGALDRFAQFFTAPLFTESATDREMKAVDNENKKNLQNDYWRLFQLLKSTSRLDHPFSKFGTGNLTTLADLPKQAGLNVREELIKFHQTYYSANMMKLTIFGKESLDQLEKWAVAMFSGVVNTKRSRPLFDSEPFHAESLQKFYYVAPVKDLRELSIYWAWPAVNHLYKAKPASLFGHLLGHEGAGSVLSYLKKKGWANSLSAGLSQNCTTFAAMGCSLELTEEGLDHVTEVVQVVYQYIDLLKKADEKEWKSHWQECADISAMSFRFKSTERPFSYSTALSSNLQVYAAGDVLSGPYLYEEFDMKSISALLEKLVPSNSRIQVVSRKFASECKFQEKWYSTPYNVVPYSQAEAKLWTSGQANPALVLPKPNNFISTDFTIYTPMDNLDAKDAKQDLKVDGKVDGKEQPVYPSLVVDERGLKLWYKLDTTFLKPKCNVQVDVVTPFSFASPSSNVLTQLYSMVLQDSLNEFAYDAEIAGLGYGVNATYNGFSFSFRGYNQKLPVLVSVVLERMRNLKVSKERFDLLKEQLKRVYENFNLEQPYQHALYEVNAFTEVKHWSIQDRRAAIAELQSEDLQAFIPALLSAANVELLAHGNITKKQAVDVAQLVKNTLKVRPLFPSQIPDARIVRLEDNHKYVLRAPSYNPEDPNSAVFVGFQIGEDELSTTAMLDFLAHIIQEPCYDQLRTKETLGYLVWSGGQNARGILMMRFIIQSGDKPANHLSDRVDAFLSLFREKLANMPDEEFKKNLDAVIARKLEKPKMLSDETSRYWAEITRHRYQFNAIDIEVESLKTTTRQDVVAFFDKYVAVNAPQRKKLDIQLFGKNHALPDESKVAPLSAAGSAPLPPVPVDNAKVVVLKEANAFKRQLPLYPCRL